VPAFLVRSYLSRCDLRLFLRNSDGYARDAASVRYTIFSASGTKASGSRLPAVRRRVGEYYVPWIADVPNGTYRVEWEVRDDFCSVPFTKDEFFVVVDPSAYPPPGSSWCGSEPAGPEPDGPFTFSPGQMLGAGDLPLFLRNSSGFLQDAYAVFFTVADAAGRPVSPRTAASRSGVGTYYAQWMVSVLSGDYTVLWEFQQDSTSPLQSAREGFVVVAAVAPYVPFDPGVCGSSCGPAISASCAPNPAFFPTASGRCSPCASPPLPPMPMPPFPVCCDFEVPRTAHLATGVLPAGGAYTGQPAYSIPRGIRDVTFYVTYTRGAPGGYPSVRLLWGDGTTESQETIIDVHTSGTEPTSAQNLFLQEMNGPVPADGNPISFIVEGSVPGGASTARLIVAEKGAPGTPGTAGITLTASTD
jgi:hypothetical protein